MARGPRGYLGFRRAHRQDRPLDPVLARGARSVDVRLPEAIDFPARDGVTLHGLLYLPIDKKIAKPPVVLAVHGGPTGQARPSFNASVQYLLARGIAVFDLNFRGSVGYGKKFARLDNQRLRPNAVRDMADAIGF